ncbi:hypothetical protein GFS31_21320 [Leptolyngbya sp. BL0902]|uniref:hypothetical protein n=1 Tax=Leptolyngbya sp. BL0902 TaxID=1115757 RepID=UPI0018E8C6C3|nr:hypothetical protein [Leptolyngbya sp. BL0902]QQE65444.1 hypothetical protein GFS31_21320 [Leptolyngbya sp. BL0902]
MRARIDSPILYLHQDDVPPYKKSGSVVRNNYFWALRSIADRAFFNQDWEFADEVWPALVRMLTSFAESGYLGFSETMLEFAEGEDIPAVLKPMATWVAPEEEDEGPED